MTDHPSGQLTGDAADYYEKHFVPALFKERTGAVLDCANVTAGDAVLDVGCGTGVLAREAWRRMDSTGTITGIDLNEGMIRTARRVAPDLDWQVGQAECLPFDDASFDHVISQFALMFFEDKKQGLAEMWRVTRPDGRLTVAVWDKLEHTPGYAAMVALDARLFGDHVAKELLAPYSMGDKHTLQALFKDAGITGISLTTADGLARFASIKAWVDLDVEGWTLGEMIGADGHARLLLAAQDELQQFIQADGSVAFSSPYHVISATKS